MIQHDDQLAGTKGFIPSVAKRPPEISFGGRVLFLADDAELIRRQLHEGLNPELTRDLKAKLRDQISTDEITPAYICFFYDETLGDFPYLGLEVRSGGAGGHGADGRAAADSTEAPIERGTVRAGGFICSVAGKRRGKGSSREQSPYAELMAGIKVVVSESIERIYNENCQNLGILTTTNFGLIDRIRSGEPIPLSEFTAGTDEITRQIIEYGGLFEFNMARLQGQVTLPAPRAAAGPDGASERPAASRGSQAEDDPQAPAPPRPMTLGEKIFASKWVVDAAEGHIGTASAEPGEAGFFRADIRFSHEYVTPMAAIFFEQKLGSDAKVLDPGSILFFRDHLTFLHKVMSQERIEQGLLAVANELEVKQRGFSEKQGIRLYGEQQGHVMGSEAICHSKILEDYAEPGMLIIGTDSHTPHAGAVGALAFGVGTTAIFNSWITKDVRARIPPSFKVVVDGTLPANCTAKDLMLEILRHPYVRDGHAIGQIIEYAGPVVERLSVDERATMTNMAAEVGAFTGLVAADERTVEFLVEERGMDEARARKLVDGVHSDPGAKYVKIIEIDASRLRPMVALPGDPGNGLYIDELADPVPIEIAYAGSCTAGKKEDMDMYARVFREAWEREGRGVHPDVDCYIQCGSTDVREYARRQGYLDLFRAIGAEFIEPGCGACIAAGPGITRSPDQVSVSSQNRNFPGRSGPGQLYLVSPYSVAASAVAGRVVGWEPNRPANLLRRSSAH
ncbi:MAG: aconitase family protein [Gemmatimonadota bacterium]|nr:aconitase family protein [Gemmatimonadota bacterium]